jgi:hypothetical protein
MSDEVTELKVAIAKVEGKIDTLIGKVEGALATASDHEARLRVVEKATSASEDHEARLKKVERLAWTLVGAGTAAGTAGGALASTLIGG